MSDETSPPSDQSDELAKNPETSVEKMPQTTNIVHFVESLRATDEYKSELGVRRSKLEASRAKLDPKELEPLTTEILAGSWEGRDEFKDFFFDYVERVVGLRYSNEIDPAVNTAFSAYREVVRQMKEERESNPDQSEILALDNKRGRAHNDAGRAIYEYLYNNGVYSNLEEDRTRGEIMGRCIAWSWLVDQGLDVWNSGRLIDERRRARSVVDGQTLKIKTSYKPGDQRWFQDEESIESARKIAEGIFSKEEITEETTTEQTGSSTPLNLEYTPPLTLQDDQEHASNPLRGGKPFS